MLSLSRPGGRKVTRPLARHSALAPPRPRLIRRREVSALARWLICRRLGEAAPGGRGCRDQVVVVEAGERGGVAAGRVRDRSPKGPARTSTGTRSATSSRAPASRARPAWRGHAPPCGRRDRHRGRRSPGSAGHADWRAAQPALRQSPKTGPGPRRTAGRWRKHPAFGLCTVSRSAQRAPEGGSGRLYRRSGECQP